MIKRKKSKITDSSSIDRPFEQRSVGGSIIILSFFILLNIFLTVSCLPRSPRIILPAEINNLGGEATFYVRSPEREGRSRLGFYFELPDRVRLEIFNPFGGLESLLWLNGRQAILYIPKEKVFWRGESRWITADFLGGEMEASELVGVFSARWSVFTPDDGWEVFRDEEGRVLGGKKGGLKFEIKETFPGTEMPKTVYFEAENFKVRVRLLKLRFNQRWKENFFTPSFPAGTKQLSWGEISELWKR
ncbi:MAG: hypothetical protein H5U06_08315 [Candidatus Aminicenantes bacterium]|nr:hypothetical protein [Candidatus Aminicenantes bacterium]